MALASPLIIIGIFLSASWALDPPKICKTNEDCNSASFCKTYTGMCDGPYGYCSPITINCFHGYGACGCDGKSYDSECEAAKLNVSIVYLGKCLEDNNCKKNADCDDDYNRFCEYQNNCKSNGICKGFPQYCPLEIGVVCGCDNKNYMNECQAAANGTSVMFIQPCKIGYCTKNDDCDADSTCLMPAGICNSDASQGVCVLKPANCSNEYAPVCGCDERTYPNACIALQQGATINEFLPCH